MSTRPPTIGPVENESASESTDPVVLSFPAEATYARVARLAVSALASRVGFSYDDIEDVRMAVGEVCGILLDGTSGRLSFTVDAREGSLAVATRREPAEPRPEVTDLNRQILEAVCDEVVIDPDTATVTVTKRAGQD